MTNINCLNNIKSVKTNDAPTKKLAVSMEQTDRIVANLQEELNNFRSLNASQNNEINNVLPPVAPDVLNDDIMPFKDDVAIPQEGIIPPPNNPEIKSPENIAPVITPQEEVTNTLVEPVGPTIIPNNPKSEFDTLEEQINALSETLVNEVNEAIKKYKTDLNNLITESKKKIDNTINEAKNLKEQAMNFVKDAQAAAQVADVARQNAINLQKEQAPKALELEKSF